MQITFTLANAYGVTPFEIMAQDIDEVIMVINYYIGIGANAEKSAASEREAAKTFWDCV